MFSAPRPTNAKGLMRFLGQVRWHSRVLCHLAEFAQPLHVASHATPFRWTAIEQWAFDALKILLSRAPVVQPPCWDLDFHVFVDASEVAIGSVLTQLYEPRWYKPVYYASRRLTAVERNYSTTEREALGLIFSITKFRHYLLGRKFTFHVDHAALLYIADKSSLTGKLALLLQEFTFDIVHRPGPNTRWPTICRAWSWMLPLQSPTIYQTP